MQLFRWRQTDKWTNPWDLKVGSLGKTELHSSQEAKKTKNSICPFEGFEGCQTVWSNMWAHVKHVRVHCPDSLLSETCFATLDHRGAHRCHVVCLSVSWCHVVTMWATVFVCVNGLVWRSLCYELMVVHVRSTPKMNMLHSLNVCVCIFASGLTHVW